MMDESKMSLDTTTVTREEIEALIAELDEIGRGPCFATSCFRCGAGMIALAACFAMAYGAHLALWPARFLYPSWAIRGELRAWSFFSFAARRIDVWVMR